MISLKFGNYSSPSEEKDDQLLDSLVSMEEGANAYFFKRANFAAWFFLRSSAAFL